VGVSADAAATLKAFAEQNGIKHLLLADFRRQMIPAYGAMVTDQNSPIFRYAKRAFFVIDRQGTVRFMKVMDNALDLLKPEELLQAIRETGS
jgi:peroxiredoxin